jgi:hypothetical protein
MRSLRVSNHVYQQLTRLLGKLTAQSGIMKTFNDVVEDLVSRRVFLPPEMLRHVQEFVVANEQFGYGTKEEFIIDAVQQRLRILSGDYKLVKLPKERYKKLESAIREMKLPYRNVTDFIDKQIKQKKVT